MFHRKAARLPICCFRSSSPSLLPHHLVHAARPQAGAHSVGHCLGGLDVGGADVQLARVVAGGGEGHASVSERARRASLPPPRHRIWGRPPLAALHAIGAASDLVTRTARRAAGRADREANGCWPHSLSPSNPPSPERLAPQRGGQSGGGGGGSRRGGRHRVGRRGWGRKKQKRTAKSVFRKSRARFCSLVRRFSFLHGVRALPRPPAVRVGSRTPSLHRARCLGLLATACGTAPVASCHQSGRVVVASAFERSRAPVHRPTACRTPPAPHHHQCGCIVVVTPALE